MPTHKILIGWIVAAEIVMVWFNLRVVLPEFINMHSDAFLLAAFVLVGVTVTIPVLTYYKVIKPLLEEL